MKLKGLTEDQIVYLVELVKADAQRDVEKLSAPCCIEAEMYLQNNFQDKWALRVQLERELEGWA